MATLYAHLVPYEYRRAHGQFFTPLPVAAFMVRWAVTPQARSFLDPAVGTGIFLQEAVRIAPHLPRLCGYEVDPVLAEIARQVLATTGCFRPQIRREDFLRAEVPGPFDAIVCNPPYIRYREMAHSREVLQTFAQAFNLPLSGFTNLYGLFLVKIAALLAPFGRAAVLTAGDFLNADFGEPLKRFLLTRNLLEALLIFPPTQLLFGEPLTTTCLLLLSRGRAADAPVRLIRLSNFEAVSELSTVLARPAAEASGPGWIQTLRQPHALPPERKWRVFFLSPASASSPYLVPLSELALARRGIATGANSFFTLTAAEVEQWGLEREFLRPCLAKASFAPFFDFTLQDFHCLAAAGKKVYLLYCEGPGSEALKRYLRYGEELGVPTRYLPRHRRPWFAPEKRPVAPVLVTVFSRTRLRFVFNRAGVWNLTAFHGIYPRFADPVRLRALMAYLISERCGDFLEAEARVYGAGLRKVEPRDVMALPVVDVRRLPPPVVEKLARLFEELCTAQRDQEGLPAVWARLAQVLEPYVTGDEQT